jgi:hypothetical protein
MKRLMIALAALAATATPVQAAERPRLVVQITFDQLRGDLLDRYRPAFTGGLKRVLDEGWWVRNGEAAHGITVSWPGHTTLATGLFPSHHGLTANEWWEEVGGSWREVGATDDPRYRTLGRDNRPGESVVNLRGTSIGDWFKAANPSAKVVAIGSDAAVPYGGHQPDGVFWYDGRAGGFTTSTNYASALPDWVARLNARIAKLPSEWSFSVPDFRPLADHPQRCPAFGTPARFPHRYEAGSAPTATSFMEWVGSTPLVDEELLRHAGDIVRANHLGEDDVPDYLAIISGSTDGTGHEYGPVSPEQLDTLVRLDHALGEFIDDLDRSLGKDGYVLAISADHGATDPPENQCLHRVTTAEIDDLLDRVEAIASNHRGGRTSLVKAIIAELERSPFIGGVYTAERLERAEPGDWKAQLMRRSVRPDKTPNFPLWSEKPRPFHPARYGIFVIFKEGVIFDAATSVHGSPYPADRLVPVIFYGAGVRHHMLESGARTVDVAPTLGSLAGIATPAKMDGQVVSVRASRPGP